MSMSAVGCEGQSTSVFWRCDIVIIGHERERLVDFSKYTSIAYASHCCLSEGVGWKPREARFRGVNGVWTLIACDLRLKQSECRRGLSNLDLDLLRCFPPEAHEEQPDLYNASALHWS